MSGAQFVHSDLGQCSRGDVVEVTLSNGANVRLLDSTIRLLDSTNFGKYKRGEQHRCHGGLAKKSPVRLQIPSSGHWYVVVDMQGLRGSTRASFRKIPAEAFKPLPPIRQASPQLSEIAHALAQEAGTDDREFDVFISHASEDKDAVVRPLAHALGDRGLTVWYDEFELGQLGGGGAEDDVLEAFEGGDAGLLGGFGVVGTRPTATRPLRLLFAVAPLGSR